MPIDFTLTPEQRELQLSSRRFARRALAEVGPATDAIRRRGGTGMSTPLT
jgi:hypothetical protein